jgi:hypothetical protein
MTVRIAANGYSPFVCYKKLQNLADLFLRQTKNPAAITATTKNKIKIG